MITGKKRVLITGCSSGIGRALSLEFHKNGHLVYATARNPETLKDLADLGIFTLKLDVNNPEDILAAAALLEKDRGGIDILINNAGFIAMGPLVEIPIDRLRLQFETNVVSIIAMIQAFAPSMIRNRNGRIVNIGSVSGILPSPFAGAYCASKTAVHSLSDVLRAELSPFGIQVITVQPGGIMSELGKTAHKGIANPDNDRSCYAGIKKAIEKRALASQINATPVNLFARNLVFGLLKHKPKPMIRLGKQSFLLPFIRNIFPTALRDWILIRKFRLNTLK